MLREAFICSLGARGAAEQRAGKAARTLRATIRTVTRLTRPAAFLLKQLIDVDIYVAFIAPSTAAKSSLDVWPRIWARDDRGVWTPLDFVGARRARQLACLLAWHHDGLRAGTVDRYFGRLPEDGTSADIKPAKKAGASARKRLTELLAEVGLDDRLVVPLDRSGWRLDRASCDVELASLAVAHREWEAASLLTYAGDGRLIGFAKSAASTRPIFWLRARADDRDAIRAVLPRALVQQAEQAADAIRAHYVAAPTKPPNSPGWIERFLAALSATNVRQQPPTDHDKSGDLDVIDAEVVEEWDVGEASAGASMPPGRPTPHDPAGNVEVVPAQGSELLEIESGLPMPTRQTPTIGQASPRPTELPVPETAGTLVIPVRPLQPRLRSSRALAGVAAAAVLATAVLAAVVLAGTGGDGAARSTTMTGTHARLEQETFTHDVKTFADPHHLADDATVATIGPGQVVLVSCRVYVPSIPSSRPYWWYKIVTDRWRGRFVTANTFLNGDTATAYTSPRPAPPKHSHDYDTAVPVCKAGEPGGSVETPRQSRTATFSDATSGAGPGPPITDGDKVTVSCKLRSGVTSTEPGSYAYRLSSSPWRDRYYAPSRAFRNAIPADSRDAQLVDIEVPDCPSA